MNDDGLIPFDSNQYVAGERHIIQKEEELRIECKFSMSASNKKVNVLFVLQKGSCECQGLELALHKVYCISSDDTVNQGGMKLAFYTWHGAVMDIVSNYDHIITSSYISDETSCNIAYVNTHAQLEVLRDDAVIAQQQQQQLQLQQSLPLTPKPQSLLPPISTYGPRVLICGPKECGKSSLVRILTAYACKLGRTPIVIDLDPADNLLSVPGTFSTNVIHQNTLSMEMYLQNAMMTTTTSTSSSSSNNNHTTTTQTPLVLWHGSTNIQEDLYKAQTIALAQKVQQKMIQDDWIRSSGFIINTNSMIQDDSTSSGTSGSGSSSSASDQKYQLLLHTINVFQINVVLVIGHDRLYSVLRNKLAKITTTTNKENDPAAVDMLLDETTTTKPTGSTNSIKVIKVPRSGGVVSRDQQYLRTIRSRAIKRYFYGNTMDSNPTTSTSGTTGISGTTNTSTIGTALMNNNNTNNTNSSNTTSGVTNLNSLLQMERMPQLTPYLLQISFHKLKIYKFVAMNLAASLLPVNAMSQTTEKIQIQPITTLLQKSDNNNSTGDDGTKQQQPSSSSLGGGTSSSAGTTTIPSGGIPTLQTHTLVAVCHPQSVQKYEQSGYVKDLYQYGVAGFILIEKIVYDTDMIHFLTPCAGSLPSNTLLLGDNTISWME